MIRPGAKRPANAPEAGRGAAGGHHAPALNWRRYAPLIALILAVTIPLWGARSDSARDIAVQTLIFMMATIAWNIIGGYGGQVSFGHSIFFGIGAYTTALLFANYQINTWLAVVAGCVLAGLVSVGIGLLTFRLRGIYFSLATFTCALILELLATHFVGITGGAVGLSIPYLGNAPGQMQFDNKLTYFYLALVLVVAFQVISWWIFRSRLGFRLRATHDDEAAARASGVPVRKAKLGALLLSAVMTAVAGALYVQYVSFIDPNSAFGETTAIQIVLLSFVGGAGTLWGPVIGATLFVPLQQSLGSSLSARPGLSLVIYGVLVAAIITLEPHGLIRLFASDGVIRTWLARKRRGAGAPTAGVATQAEAAEVLAEAGAIEAPQARADVDLSGIVTRQPREGAEPHLSVKEVRVQFGGLRAVDDVSLTVAPGELFGIVGPNGAGKTTLFNAIAGAVTPTSGRIQLSGRRIDGKASSDVARAGVARTFQNVRLFNRMTVRENLIVAAASHLRLGDARRLADQILDLLGLAAVADEKPSVLPLATNKQAEIGRALALRPSVLLLDEMMSGLNDVEMTELIDVVRRLNRAGLTIVVIEHVVRVMVSLTDRLVVLDHGGLIAEGPPAEVMGDPRVVEAYLGAAASRGLRTDGQGPKHAASEATSEVNR